MYVDIVGVPHKMLCTKVLCALDYFRPYVLQTNFE